MKNLAICILLNVVLFAASLSMTLAYTVDRPLVMFAEGRPEVVSQGGCSPSNPSACNPFSTCKTWYGPSGGPINSFQYYPDGTAVALPALQTEVPTATGWGTAYYQQWPSTQQDSVLSGLQWEGYSAGNIFSNVPFTLGRFTHRNFPITVYDLNGTLITKPCNKIQMDIIFQLTDSSSSTPFVTTKQISIDLQVDETPNTGCDPAYQAVLPNPYTNPWAGFGRGSCPFGCPSPVCDGTTCAREQVVSPTDYPCSDPLNGFNVPYGVDCGSGCFDRISILNSGATSSSVFTNPNNNQNYYLAILGFAVQAGDDPINTFITAEYESNSAYLYANVVQTCNAAGDCNDGVSCTIPSCSPPSGNYPAKYCTYALDDTRCQTLGDGCADGVCTKTGCSFTGYNNRCNAMGPCISSSTCTQSQADPSNWNCVYGAPDNTKCNYLKTSIPGCIPICNTTGYCGCLPTTTTTTTTKTTTTTPTTTTTTTPTPTTKTTTTKTTTTTTTTTLCWRSLTQTAALSSFGLSKGVSIPPATTLYVGYTVALANAGSDTDVAIVNSYVKYNSISCPGFNGRTLTVGIPDRTLTLPGDKSFVPSNITSDPATYQGVWYTADVCNGFNFNMSNTAQMTFYFQAYLPASGPDVTLNVKFHFTTQPYDAGCCGSGTPFSTVYSLTINTCASGPKTTTTKASTTSTPTTTSTTKTTTTSTTTTSTTTTSTTRPTTTSTTSTSTPTTTSTSTPTTTSTTRPTTTTTTRPTTTTTTTTTTTQCPTACKLCLADLSLFLQQEPSCDNSCGDPYGSKTICVYDSNNADWYPVSVSNDQIYTYFLTAYQQQWNFFAQTSQNHNDPSGKPARFDCDCNQIPPSTTTTTPPPPPQILPKLSCVFCNVAQCWATIGYDATGQTPDVDGGFVVTRTVKPNINNYMTIKVGTGATVLAGVNGNLGQPTSFSTLGAVSSAAIITFSRFATITWYLDAIPLVIKQGAALPCINCDFPGLITADAINTPDTVGVSYKLDFTSLLIFCGGSSSSRTTYLNTPRYFVADIPTCAQMFLPTVSPAGCTPQYAPIATWVPYPTWDPTVVNPSCFWNSMDSPYVVPLLPKTPSGSDCSKVTITIQMPKASCPQVTLDVDDVGGLFDSTCLNCQECRTIGILGITSKCPVPQYCTPLSDGTPTSWNSATCQCEPCLLSCPPNWTPSAITCKCVPCDPDLCTPGLNYNTPTTCGQCTPCPANPEDQCAWNERVYKTLNPPVYFSNAITGCPECGPCDSCPSGQTYLGDDCTCGPCQNCLPGCSCSCPTCPIGYELDLENIDPPSTCPCIACNVTCPPGSWLKDKDNQCLGCISCPLLDCGFGQTLTEDLCHCEQCSTEPCASGFRTDPDTGCGCVECQELCSVGTILSDDKCSCIPVNITEPPTTPPVCAGGTIDVCGVCNGDGKACLGCDGQPGSPRWYDPCRVACGNGSTCNYCKNDECNVCTLEVDICGVCGGNGSSCLGCDGLPPTLTRPPTQYDWCGVCGGNGTSCLGCDGRPFSGPCPSGITPGAAAAVASLSALAALSAIAVALLLARLRKRPELLYQAWDDTLRDYITEIESNPLYNADEQEHNPLWARGN